MKQSSKVAVGVLALAAAGLGVAYKSGAFNQGPFDWMSEPVIKLQPGSQDSLHVEYPSVYAAGSTHYMLYSAYGDDRRWRIEMATTSDGETFVKQGNIFDESKLAFAGGYAFPFVRNVASEKSSSYEMYFAAGDSITSGYTGIYKSTSANGFAWGAPERIIQESGLDPIVISEGDRETLLYTVASGDLNVIKAVELNKDGKPLQSRVVYTPQQGIYTLGLLHWQEIPIVIVEAADTWLPLCFNASGELAAIPGEPILRTNLEGDTSWDRLKYGMFFSETNSKVYYNGIEGHGFEQGGQIGVATYKPAKLFQNMDFSSCR
ncbi:hypothetical protein ACIPZ8_16845 [Pseudomonas sp. NPDC089422]|uniref:hypothetical protein n=1 Tax=Pseudomonas sp. NPDC089422 TaxID=3364466 RepID=UPI0037FAAC14